MCMLFLASEVDFLTLHLFVEGNVVLFDKSHAQKKVARV